MLQTYSRYEKLIFSVADCIFVQKEQQQRAVNCSGRGWSSQAPSEHWDTATTWHWSALMLSNRQGRAKTGVPRRRIISLEGKQNHRAGRDLRKSFLLPQDRAACAQAVIGLTNLFLEALLSDGSRSPSFPRLPAPVLHHLYHLEVIPDIQPDFLDNT